MTVRKIDLMHLQFGVCEDPAMTCKTCDHLVRHRANRQYYKCEIYGDTSSVASDWKVSNRACGLYNKPYDGSSVMRLVRSSRKDEKPIDGQMDMWDLEDMYDTLCPWRK